MKKIIFALITIGVLTAACKKMQVDSPGLAVTVENLTLKAGDTAKFHLSGYADFVNFYSGEPGRSYDRKDSFSMTGGNPEFQFSSAVSAPGTGVTTGNNLSVLVSTNFNGIYDAASVRSATWTDVTSRATLATTTTTVASPIANLNDLKVEGKPMYVAFKYISATPSLKQRQWTISAFQFRTKFPNTTVYTHAASNTDAVFKAIDIAGDSATWVGGTTLTHVGLNAAYPADEDWAISKAFDLNKSNSDASGVSIIKNYTLTGNIPATFNSKYTTAGIYKAVFVIRNATINVIKETIQEFTITITP